MIHRALALALLAGHVLGQTAPLSGDEFHALHAQLVPKCADAWQTIPWRTDLLLAAREAAAQGKLLFLWSMNGHPLGCT